jgi:hypothetical protein
VHVVLDDIIRTKQHEEGRSHKKDAIDRDRPTCAKPHCSRRCEECQWRDQDHRLPAGYIEHKHQRNLHCGVVIEIQVRPKVTPLNNDREPNAGATH